MQIIREDNEGVQGFCDRLFYDFNAKDLKLAYNYVLDGEVRFSRHVTFWELAHLANTQPVPSSPYDTREQFFMKAQHRSILPCEVLIDLDEDTLGEGIRFPSIERKALWVYKTLFKEGYLPVWYKTGSKGAHISIIIKRLARLSPEERRAWRMGVIERFGGDLMKAGDGAMIALEGAKHFKSGVCKERVA